MRHARLHKPTVIICALTGINGNASEIVSAAGFLWFTVLAGTPTLGAALKRRRLGLICIVIRAFSFGATAHWNIMACLLRTFNCTYAGAAAFFFSLAPKYPDSTTESLPLLLKKKVLL